MQCSLVAHYGNKPPGLEELIRRGQRVLAEQLGPAFQPYGIPQVHATIVGLEGERAGRRVLAHGAAGEPSTFEPGRLLDYLRAQDFPSFQVQIGGFQPTQRYPFASRGHHPYLRSFSVQGEIAVAMGWPVDVTPDGGVVYPETLADLRWTFTHRLGIRHKWHRHIGERDNDFFFVLGRVARAMLDAERVHEAEEATRRMLAADGGVRLPVNSRTLQIVGYVDPQLPPETSCSFPVTDPALTPERLLALYSGSDAGISH